MGRGASAIGRPSGHPSRIHASPPRGLQPKKKRAKTNVAPIMADDDGRSTSVAALEVCIDSVASALEAEAGGATRLELCDALVEGGLTPSIGKASVTLRSTRLPVHAMIRPRGGDFLYDPEELEVMRADMDELKRVGVHGLVLGVLTADGQVDEPLLCELVRRAAPLPVTFHRAIDMSRDPVAAVHALIRAGVARVLTSGGAPTALEGVATLRRMVAASAGRLIVAAAGGVTESNASSLVLATGVAEVHGTLRESADGGMAYRPALPIYMGGEKHNSAQAEFARCTARRSRVGAITEVLRSAAGSELRSAVGGGLGPISGAGAKCGPEASQHSSRLAPPPPGPSHPGAGSDGGWALAMGLKDRIETPAKGPAACDREEGPAGEGRMQSGETQGESAVGPSEQHSMPTHSVGSHAVLGHDSGVSFSAILDPDLGRPSATLDPGLSGSSAIPDRDSSVLGLDLGGTNIQAAVVTRDGCARGSVRLPLTDRTPAGVVDLLLRACGEALSAAGCGWGAVQAVGLGAPGLIDDGIVRAASNFPGWKDVPLARLLSEVTGLPTLLVNDALAAAAAEAWVGAAAGVRDGAAVVTLGTGVGVALVAVDGTVRQTEGGHHIIDASSGARDCACGQRGCWQQYASATALVAQYGAGSRQGSVVDCQTIFERATCGEQRAQALVDELCSAIAVGCINLSRLASVPLVVLTGGVAEAGDRFINRVNEHIAIRSWQIAPPLSRAVGAGVAGSLAGVLGAAAMAMQGMGAGGQHSSGPPHQPHAIARREVVTLHE